MGISCSPRLCSRYWPCCNSVAIPYVGPACWRVGTHALSSCSSDIVSRFAHTAELVCLFFWAVGLWAGGRAGGQLCGMERETRGKLLASSYVLIGILVLTSWVVYALVVFLSDDFKKLTITFAGASQVYKFKIGYSWFALIIVIVQSINAVFLVFRDLDK